MNDHFLDWANALLDNRLLAPLDDVELSLAKRVGVASDSARCGPAFDDYALIAKAYLLLDWGLDDIGPDAIMAFAGLLADRQLLLDDRDDLLALLREFRCPSSHLTGSRGGVFSFFCAHAHRRCTRLSSIVHVNGIELLQNVGHPLAFGVIADKHGERSSAFAQVGVIPAAVVLWYVTSEKPIPEALMAFVRRSAGVGALAVLASASAELNRISVAGIPNSISLSRAGSASLRET